MSEVKGFKCDICGLTLDKRPTRSVLAEGDAHGLYFYWSEHRDVCESCQRNLWLALGKERGWRVSRERAAQASSGAAEPPVTPMPPASTPKRRRGRAAQTVQLQPHEIPDFGGDTRVETHSEPEANASIAPILREVVEAAKHVHPKASGS